MIITLVKANFSTNNIGTLDSFAVLTNLGSGLTYSGPNSVIKNAALDATITLDDNYTLDNFSITMGGVTLSDAHTIDGKTITINIAAVTGIITIVASTVGDSSTPEVTSEWYINTLNQLADSGKDLTTATDMTNATKYAPWAFSENINSKVVGKTINAIEIVPHQAGTFSVGKVNSSTYEYTTMAAVTITSDQLKTRAIYTFAPYTINEGEFFTFNADGDAGMTGYFLKANVDPLAVECVTKMHSNCDSGSMSDFAYEMAIMMNVGYIAGLDDDSNSGEDSGNDDSTTTPSNDATWYVASLKQLQDSGNNLSTNGVKLSPSTSYAWAFNEQNANLVGKTINTIELYPHTAGTFHIGKYNDSTNTVTESREFTITETNTPVTCYFDDMTINEGEHFVWNNCTTVTGEAVGYYVLKAKLDSSAVETGTWYQAKSSGLATFGGTSPYELVFVANIGYTPAE